MKLESPLTLDFEASSSISLQCSLELVLAVRLMRGRYFMDAWIERNHPAKSYLQWESFERNLNLTASSETFMKLESPKTLDFEPFSSISFQGGVELVLAVRLVRGRYFMDPWIERNHPFLVASCCVDPGAGIDGGFAILVSASTSKTEISNSNMFYCFVDIIYIQFWFF